MSCNHGQNLNGNSIKFIKASPGPSLCKTTEDICNGLEVHLVRAIEHIARNCQSTCKIFCCFCFARSSRTCGGTTQIQFESHCQCNVATICKWRDDETSGVANPLVKVLARKIANLNVDIKCRLLPFKAKLLLPRKCIWPFRLLGNEAVNDITRVHIHGNERNNFCTVISRKFA